MFDKIWEQHVVARKEGEALLYIDRNFVHEGAFHAFFALEKEGRKVRRPRQTFATADHYVPTVGRGRGLQGITDPEVRGMVELLEHNARENQIPVHLGIDDPRQGIVHVIGPELGISLPGMTIVCGDSHTSTHGALGIFAMGIGTSEVEHVMATQCLLTQKPKTMNIRVDGTLAPGVTAKDVALAVIRKLGTDVGTHHVIEFSGSAIRSLSVEGRMTLCNMAIEAGARAGMVAPDDVTIEYVKGRRYAPEGELFEQAAAQWKELASDPGAQFDAVYEINVDGLGPQITWGTDPGMVADITGMVPDPAAESDPAKRLSYERALEYMGLTPGQKMQDIDIQTVFIGSCTNSRLSDLREAATVVEGRNVAPGVRAVVVPGSMLVRRQAEEEGLADIFRAAGFEWREAGCSMCIAINGDRLSAGERCASTSNRNFEGRQGRGGRTHLVSPVMAAGAAIAGHFVDVRDL
jgi:3-isopropylmalate/(R)-2-methylmalate dehydratase large subunit